MHTCVRSSPGIQIQFVEALPKHVLGKTLQRLLKDEEYVAKAQERKRAAARELARKEGVATAKKKGWCQIGTTLSREKQDKGGGGNALWSTFSTHPVCIHVLTHLSALFTTFFSTGE